MKQLKYVNEEARRRFKEIEKKLTEQNESDKAKLDCPYSDPLHLHHDGCPSCYTEKEKNENNK